MMRDVSRVLDRQEQNLQLAYSIASNSITGGTCDVPLRFAVACESAACRTNESVGTQPRSRGTSVQRVDATSAEGTCNSNRDDRESVHQSSCS